MFSNVCDSTGTPCRNHPHYDMIFFITDLKQIHIYIYIAAVFVLFHQNHGYHDPKTLQEEYGEDMEDWESCCSSSEGANRTRGKIKNRKPP